MCTDRYRRQTTLQHDRGFRLEIFFNYSLLFIRATRCDSLMRNLGVCFSQQKLGQRIDPE